MKTNHIPSSARIFLKLKMFGFTAATFFIQNFSKAQDTLQYRNGKQVIAKVVEITPTLVKYNKMENLTGPIYSDLKNDLQYIKYKNGQVEFFEIQKEVVVPIAKSEPVPVFTKQYLPLKKYGHKYIYGANLIGERETFDILLSLKNRKITDHIQLAKQQKAFQYIGFAAIPCGIAALYFADRNGGYPPITSEQRTNNLNNASIMGILGLACITTSITLKVKRNKNAEEALRLYQLNY